jgi:hypothetical protein
MAITKKAAKKAVPKVKEEPKQIVLTQEQYDELVDMKWELNRISNEIKNISTEDDKNSKEVAFEMGILQVRVDKLNINLEKITDDVDPEPLNNWGDDDDDTSYN